MTRIILQEKLSLAGRIFLSLDFDRTKLLIEMVLHFLRNDVHKLKFELSEKDLLPD